MNREEIRRTIQSWDVFPAPIDPLPAMEIIQYLLDREDELVAEKEELLEAIRLTQEHIVLPCLPGWEWWDAYRKHRPNDADRLQEQWLWTWEVDT